MSGCSYDDTCPNCGGELMVSSDHKPFQNSSTMCLDCGFYSWTSAGYMGLDEVNDERREFELRLLQGLPEQDRTIWTFGS